MKQGVARMKREITNELLKCWRLGSGTGHAQVHCADEHGGSRLDGVARNPGVSFFSKRRPHRAPVEPEWLERELDVRRGLVMQVSNPLQRNLPRVGRPCDLKYRPHVSLGVAVHSGNLYPQGLCLTDPGARSQCDRRPDSDDDGENPSDAPHGASNQDIRQSVGSGITPRSVEG